jgi:hypothetical protein
MSFLTIDVGFGLGNADHVPGDERPIIVHNWFRHWGLCEGGINREKRLGVLLFISSWQPLEFETFPRFRKAGFLLDRRRVRGICPFRARYPSRVIVYESSWKLGFALCHSV